MSRADHELLFEDFIPQGEFRYPVSALRERLDLREEHDDLDSFVGGAFLMDDEIPFTIKHYRGSQPDVFTIYFHRAALHEIPHYVSRILSGLDIPESAKTWDRSKNPEL